jgi:hypothetical protein
MIENDNAGISPLRRRMIEDMTARRLAEPTQIAHLRAVTLLAEFLRKSPDTVSSEDLRRFRFGRYRSLADDPQNRRHSRPV